MKQQNEIHERLLRINQVREMTGLSRSSLYHLSSENKFPPSIALVPGGTSRAWLESEVRAWINQRIEARNAGVQ
jgi:prophage regulatory protein